jgi:putative MATE family efflux protein
MSYNEIEELKDNKLGVMPVRRLIIGMSIPAMISMLVGALYNVVESVFVAHISEAALAGLTLVLPVQNLLVSFGVGVGVGLNSFISRRLGEGNINDANRAAANGFILSLCNWVIFAVFGLFFADPFFSLFTDIPEVHESALLYCRIVLVGSIFPFISVNIERILQAEGNMIYPMLFNIVGAGMNCFLSPFLITGALGFPRFGVMGAGIACIISQFVATGVAVYFLFTKTKIVKIHLRNFAPSKYILKNVLVVAVPSALMMGVGSIMNALANAILISYSAAAVAVFGVYFRMQNFVFMPIFGLNQGAMPVMGFNFGAKNKKRLLGAYKFTVMIALIIMATGTVVFQAFPHAILGLFDASPEMLDLGIPALRIICLCFLPAAFSIVSASLFQALGHGFYSLAQSLLRQLIGVIPAMFLFMHFFGIRVVWAAFPLGEVISASVCAFLLGIIYRKEIKNL